jgi:hypothetical protein
MTKAFCETCKEELIISDIELVDKEDCVYRGLCPMGHLITFTKEYN